jgi:hypothetical protein
MHVTFWNVWIFRIFPCIVELSHFSSLFWIDSTYFVEVTPLTLLGWLSPTFWNSRHLNFLFICINDCHPHLQIKATRPFLFLDRFLGESWISPLVLVDFETREKEDMQPAHIINIDIQDNHEEATIGAFLISDLVTMVRKVVVTVVRKMPS